MKFSSFFRRLWLDSRGSAVSAELVLIVTLLMIGLIVGAKSVRDAIVTEFADFAQAIANLDQSYNVPDSSPGAGDGSGFIDSKDFCDTEVDDDGPTLIQGFNASPELDMTFGVPPTGET